MLFKKYYTLRDIIYMVAIFSMLCLLMFMLIFFVPDSPATFRKHGKLSINPQPPTCYHTKYTTMQDAQKRVVEERVSQAQDDFENHLEEMREEKEVTATPSLNSATFTMTAYCSCSRCCGSWSAKQNGAVIGAAGIPLVPYISVAVDNSIFPFGTVFYDDKGNKYIAQDTGVKGYHLDVYMPTHQEAVNFALQKRMIYW